MFTLQGNHCVDDSESGRRNENILHPRLQFPGDSPSPQIPTPGALLPTYQRRRLPQRRHIHKETTINLNNNFLIN